MSYKILAIEGSGAYGTVAKARDLRNQRRIVALKVLREDHLDNPRVLCRTRDEARMLSLLAHPGVVRVYGLDESWGRPVMVMEWLEAICLGDLIDTLGTGLPIDVACETVAQASQALHHAFAHRQGDPPRPMELVHRDLKPNNMLMTIHGEVKLVDFGLAHGDFDGKESHTVSMVLGTRAYMAPERLDGAEDDPSADVYSMGLILYELLAGRAMSLSLNPNHHAERLAAKLRDLDLAMLPSAAGARLRNLIARMCAYEVEDRPAHADVVAELQATMAVASLAPDIHSFARQVVKPLVSQKQRVVPQEHPDWPDVDFLETPVPTLDLRRPTVSDPDLSAINDERIRKLLAGDRWTTHLPRLRAILQDSAWTSAPFLEVLDGALQNQWGRTTVDPRKIAMCLNLLRLRPDAEAIRRASALATYDDATVQATARQFLDAARSD